MKRILVLSDTHIGSTVGLWPPEFEAESGHHLPQSVFQKWLWECWTDAQSWVKKRMRRGDQLTIVFNGDICEGKHHRTEEIMSPKSEDQFQAAVDVFKRLFANLQPHQSVFVKGTECHSKGMEMSLGNIMGAIKDPATKQGAWDYVRLNIEGCITSFAHHCTATTRKHLQATQHSIFYVDELARAATAGEEPARVVCRAHRHEHGIWNTGDYMTCVTGPWQGLTRHGHKVVVAAVPQPSWILLSYDGQGKLPSVDHIKFTPKPGKTTIKL